MNQYEAAQAEVGRLQAQHQHWIDKRAALVTSLETLEAGAGQAALAGEPTNMLADQMSRLESEIRIVDQALVALTEHQQQAHVAALLARIVHERQQALDLLHQAAALRGQVQPHLNAIEALEGVRYYHHQPRTVRLEEEADRWLRQAERQVFALPDDVRRRLEAQRELNPTDLDRALFAIEYPGVVEEEQPV